MNTDIKIQNLIEENSALFWWIPEDKKQDISIEALVESVLNYGDDVKVKKLFDTLGIKTVAKVFQENTSNRIRINYFPEVVNYFNLYFAKHVQEYIK